MHQLHVSQFRPIIRLRAQLLFCICEPVVAKSFTNCRHSHTISLSWHAGPVRVSTSRIKHLSIKSASYDIAHLSKMTKTPFTQIAAGVVAGVAATLLGQAVLKLNQKKPLRVLITGAAGQIGYALCPLVAGGRMLGPDQPVILHLLDIEPARNALDGVKMELLDAAFPLLHGVSTFTDVEHATKGVDIAVMVGGYPRKAGEERKDVMAKNVSIYKSQASALAKNAAKGVKVVVVANPANTNALILKEHTAGGIPPENITCLTRLDHNRALSQVAERAGFHCTDVKNVIIWGNHSSTQYPDVNHGRVGGKAIREVVADNAWLDGEFVATVQQRGAAVIKARGLSSALSAASSVCDHVRNWVLGTPCGQWVSMGVVSDGSYGVTPGLVFSYPVKCSGGKWSIVQGLKLDTASKERIRVTEKELLEERELAMECLAEKAPAPAAAAAPAAAPAPAAKAPKA